MAAYRVMTLEAPPSLVGKGCNDEFPIILRKGLRFPTDVSRFPTTQCHPVDIHTDLAACSAQFWLTLSLSVWEYVREAERNRMQHLLNDLKQTAITAGASDAQVISADIIAVEDKIIRFCKNPHCPSYGKSLNCPPHCMKPDAFRSLKKDFKYGLIFKIDVPTEILLSEDQFKEFRKVYEIVAELESKALQAGYTRSRGLGAGSCKPVFCPEQACQALRKGESCRFPDIARPSMEAVGINVFKLIKQVGWEIHKITEETDPEEVPNGVLAGLVLVG